MLREPQRAYHAVVPRLFAVLTTPQTSPQTCVLSLKTHNVESCVVVDVCTGLSLSHVCLSDRSCIVEVSSLARPPRPVGQK